MKYREILNENNTPFNLFSDGFTEARISLDFLDEMTTLFDFTSAPAVFDELVHNLIDDENISPILTARLTNNTNVISDANAAKLAEIITLKYGIKWVRLWRDYYNPDDDNWLNTYNPIENYDRHETNGGSDVMQGLEADNQANRKRYGFNSANAVPVDESTVKNKQTTTFGHTLHTHGNIGVTTTAQMLSQDRDLWCWSFIDTVIHDVQDILTLAVYETEVCI